MNRILIFGVLLYLLGAGWQDLRTRRIQNMWSVGWWLLFVALHIWQGTWMAALTGFTVMGVGALFPAIFGWWGVGDWKMAMVLGTAVGALPAALLWLLGCVMARWLKPAMRRLSLRFLDEGMAEKIPLATVMGIVASALVCAGWVMRMIAM